MSIVLSNFRLVKLKRWREYSIMYGIKRKLSLAMAEEKLILMEMAMDANNK